MAGPVAAGDQAPGACCAGVLACCGCCAAKCVSSSAQAAACTHAHAGAGGAAAVPGAVMPSWRARADHVLLGAGAQPAAELCHRAGAAAGHAVTREAASKSQRWHCSLMIVTVQRSSTTRPHAAKRSKLRAQVARTCNVRCMSCTHSTAHACMNTPQVHASSLPSRAAIMLLASLSHAAWQPQTPRLLLQRWTAGGTTASAPDSSRRRVHAAGSLQLIRKTTRRRGQPPMAADKQTAGTQANTQAGITPALAVSTAVNAD